MSQFFLDTSNLFQTSLGHYTRIDIIYPFEDKWENSISHHSGANHD